MERGYHKMRRYRVSGLVRFSDDHLIFTEGNREITKKETDTFFNDVAVEVNGIVMRDGELVERNIEDLGVILEGPNGDILDCDCESCKKARGEIPIRLVDIFPS
jgi:hypothetical protein